MSERMYTPRISMLRHTYISCYGTRPLYVPTDSTKNRRQNANKKEKKESVLGVFTLHSLALLLIEDIITTIITCVNNLGVFVPGGRVLNQTQKH